MASFTEFISSFFDGLKERTKNPLIASFSISWLALNWEIVLLLFSSDLKSSDKIDLINIYIASNHFDTFYLPLLIGLGYILISDWFFLLLDFLSSFGKRLRRSNNYKYLSNQLKPKYDYLEMKKDYEEKRAKYSSLKELNTEIAEKDSLINDLKEQLGHKPKEEGSISYASFSKNEIFNFFLELAKKSKQSRAFNYTENQVQIDYLESLGLIKPSQVDSSRNQYKFQLTSLGEKYYGKYLKNIMEKSNS